LGRVTVGKRVWEVLRYEGLFIGTGKIVSRLGFTVTRFLIVTVIFLKNHQNRGAFLVA